MNFVTFGSIDPQEWDNLVLSSDDGWVFSLHSWQKLIAAVPRWRLQDCSFGITQEGELLAVVPLHYTDIDNSISSTGWGSSGPVFSSRLTSENLRDVETAAYNKINQIAFEVGAKRISITISPLTKRCLANTCGINPLHRFGYDDVSTQTMIVDLTQTQDQLWQGLSQIARRKIRSAQQDGYVVERCNWSECLNLYYRIHTETYARSGLAPHDLAYFAGIAHGPAAKGYYNLLGARSKTGKIVAFHNSAKMPHAALYNTGCSLGESFESGVNYFLMWEAMLAAKHDGCAWYEVGEFFPGARDDKSAGLTNIKTKFGGEGHRYFKGAITALQDAVYDETTAQWDSLASASQ